MKERSPFDKKIIRIGQITMTLAIFAGFLPTLYLILEYLCKKTYVGWLFYLCLADGILQVHLYIVQLQQRCTFRYRLFVVHHLKYCSKELMDVRSGRMLLNSGGTLAVCGCWMTDMPLLTLILSEASMSILAL